MVTTLAVVGCRINLWIRILLSILLSPVSSQVDLCILVSYCAWQIKFLICAINRTSLFMSSVTLSRQSDHITPFVRELQWLSVCFLLDNLQDLTLKLFGKNLAYESTLSIESILEATCCIYRRFNPTIFGVIVLWKLLWILNLKSVVFLVFMQNYQWESLIWD